MYFFEHRNIPVICLNLKLTTLSKIKGLLPATKKIKKVKKKC